MIFFLSLRNLVRNLRSSLLLLLLIALVSCVFFLGASLIGQSARGLQKTYVQNLTGDLVVQKQSRISMNLFGANTPVIDEFFTIPVLPAYDVVREIIARNDDVLHIAAIVSGKAVMDAGNQRKVVPLIGVEGDAYFDLFSGIEVDKGRVLQHGEQGVMLTTTQVEKIDAKNDASLSLGDLIRFTSAGQNSFSIREVPLIGVYHYTNPGPYMDELALTDPQTVRALSSVLSPATQEVDVEENALDLLDQSIDDLFSGDDLFSEIDLSTEGTLITDLQDEFKDHNNENSGWLGGDWNFIILRLKEGVFSLNVQNRLNNQLEEYGVRVVSWQTAAGSSALTIMLIQILFYLGMLLVGFAAVVAIVNIILISVFKRTKEIGTLRAIGASDCHIMTLLLSENFILAFLGGTVGVGWGGLFASYINAKDWPINQPLIAALLGSPNLYIEASAHAVVQSILLAILLGLFASIFPAWKAVLINPIEAVRRG